MQEEKLNMSLTFADLLILLSTIGFHVYIGNYYLQRFKEISKNE